MKPLVIDTGFFTNYEEAGVRIFIKDGQPVTVKMTTPNNQRVVFNFIFDTNFMNKRGDHYVYYTPFMVDTKKYYMTMMLDLLMTSEKEFLVGKVYVKGNY